MRRTIGLILFVGVFAVAAGARSMTPVQGASAVGSWDLTTDTPQGPRTSVLVIKKDGDKLSGVVKGQRGELPLNSASVTGNDITFVYTVQFNGQDLVITYKGKIEKDSMKGEADFGGFASGTWSAVPHKEGAAAGPAAPSGSASSAPAGNISGVWDFAVETQAGSGTPVFTFKQDGENLSGSYKGQFGEAPLTGTVKGSDVKFTMKVNAQGQDLTIVYSGKIESKDSMKGTAAIANLGEATWTAKKRP
jgi:hypothetical protein